MNNEPWHDGMRTKVLLSALAVCLATGSAANADGLKQASLIATTTTTTTTTAADVAICILMLARDEEVGRGSAGNYTTGENRLLLD